MKKPDRSFFTVKSYFIEFFQTDPRTSSQGQKI